MEAITLFQPRNSFSPEQGEGHIYLPSSLSTVGGRILAAHGEIDFQDGNLHNPEFRNNIVGVNAVGVPYIPIIIELKKKIIDAVGKEAKIIVGGQVVNGLTHKQFQQLFGSNVYNGNNDEEVKRLLGLQLRYLPSPEETSHVPVYKKMRDDDFKKYLEHEFCLYLSKGCKKNCSFCAAEHSVVDPITNKVVGRVEERYRNLQTVDAELRYMVERAKKLGIHAFEIYLSNLDTFQTPQKLQQFAKNVLAIKTENPGFQFKLRGLATAEYFMKAYKQDKTVIRDMVDAGLWSIGFGVDGTSKEVWKNVRKGFNDIDECIEAVRLTREEFNITPEVFMVVGHGKDTPQTLIEDVGFALDMANRFGAKVRPYVAKDLIPGSQGWLDPANSNRIKMLIQNPEYFQSLDYAALTSTISHPNISQEMRTLIDRAFIMMTHIPGNTTNVVYPISPELDKQTQFVHGSLNFGKFDR